jgi:hypothetical protein
VTVLRACGDASEADSAYGLLGQLVARVPETVRARFPLLRQAAPAAGASSVQVGGQLLGLLDVLQDDGGCAAVIVEDVHWGDRSSLRALGFVLRRLEADRVLTVLTTRGPASEELLRLVMDRPWGLGLTLGGLDRGSIARLIHEATGRQAPAKAVADLWRHTEGNALYVSTLLSELPDRFLLQQAGTPSWPVPA